jgi:hypothetical protein
MNSTVFLDAADLADLETFGVLSFPLGDQQFELHTRPRPDAPPTAIRITPEHLEALRTSGEVAFRRPWGRLVVSMALPAQQQPAAATIAVMQEAPIRDAGLPATYAVLAATYEELPTVVDRLLDMAAAQ